MSRSRLRSFALFTATLAISVAGLSAPAQAVDTGTISGHLTKDGVGVADAEVLVTGPTNGFASTDAAGAYQVADLPPGDYQVRFAPAGRAAQWAHQQVYRDNADLFTVTAGTTTTVDDALLPTGVVKGHVTNPDGTPAAGVKVSFENWEIDVNPQLVTDAEGNYSTEVVPGTYRILFGEWWGFYQYAPGKRDSSDAQEFVVAIGQNVVVNEALLPSGSIGGRITNSDGTPAAGRRILLRNESGGVYLTGETDGQGDYLFDKTHVDDYKLGVELPGGYDQWAHGKFSYELADAFKVNADARTTVDEQLVQTGTMSGQLTNADGSGIADADVTILAEDGTHMGVTITDSEGRWSTSPPPGKYRVQFTHWDLHFQQYAFGKLRFEDANTFTVTSGGQTTANDVRLPTGSVRVTAKDSVTGKPVSTFNATLGIHGGDTTAGSVVIPGVAIGTYGVDVWAPGYHYAENAAMVTVKKGEQAEVVVTLKPQASIKVTVVDSVTGKPVPGVCVHAFKPKSVRTSDGFCYGDGVTNATGQITVDRLTPGTYQLFAFPLEAPGYGAQWVGATRGYGDQRLAKTFTVKTGQVITGVKIKMDKAGTIAGKVTMSPEALQYARVRTLPDAPYDSSSLSSVPVDKQGNYKIDFLGPYDWPLQFAAVGYPRQWSGGVAQRFRAKAITVRSGQTTTYDYTLLKGSTSAVTVKGLQEGGWVIAYDALSGDMVAEGWATDFATDKVKLRLLGTQLLRFTVGYEFTDGKVHTVPPGRAVTIVVPSAN